MRVIVVCGWVIEIQYDINFYFYKTIFVFLLWFTNLVNNPEGSPLSGAFFLSVVEEVSFRLPNIPAEAEVVAILLIIEIVGDFGRDAREHTRLIDQMLGKAGEVSELTNVSVFRLVEDFSSRLGFVEVLHPEGHGLRRQVRGVFVKEGVEGVGVGLHLFLLVLGEKIQYAQMRIKYKLILEKSFIELVGEISTDAEALNDVRTLVAFELVEVFNIPLRKDCHTLGYHGHWFVNPDRVEGRGDDLSEVNNAVLRGLVREESEASPLGGVNDVAGGHRRTSMHRVGRKSSGKR